jgi:hypothetical protein
MRRQGRVVIWSLRTVRTGCRNSHGLESHSQGLVGSLLRMDGGQCNKSLYGRRAAHEGDSYYPISPLTQLGTVARNLKSSC